MSAESLGRRLRAEVQEQGLDELLSEARQVLELQPKSILGVPKLDKLLEISRFSHRLPSPQRQPWQSPGTSGAYRTQEDDQLHEVPEPNQSFAASPPRTAKAKLPVIELTSLASAQGKTNLLFDLTAIAIVPKTYGGKDSAVVWLDADLSFSALRLSTIIKDKLLMAGPHLPQSNVDSLAYQALQHVYVFRPQSCLQLLDTFSALPDYLLSRCAHNSISRRLAILILDSATSFLWQERLDTSTATANTPATNTRSSPSLAQQIAKHLQSLQMLFDCAVLYTTSASSGFSGSLSQIPPSPSLQSLVKPPVILSLSRQPTHQFPPHLSSQQCHSDQSQRLAAVQNAKFAASCVGRERGGDADVLRERLETVDGKAVVNFLIKADGVGIEE